MELCWSDFWHWYFCRSDKSDAEHLPDFDKSEPFGLWQ